MTRWERFRGPWNWFWAGVCVTLVIEAVMILWQSYLPPECRGDVPKMVPWHQGMSLCPGQSTLPTIEFQSQTCEFNSDGSGQNPCRVEK